jgi:hypothetical protein
MADWLHARGNPWKALVLLRAYFDESGTHAGAAATVIGGYVGTAEAWASVETKWSGILDPHRPKVTWFHMTDCIGKKNQFADMDSVVCGVLQRALAKVLKESEVEPIYMGVDSGVYEAATSPEFRRKFPKPYDYCFFNIVRHLDYWSRSDANGTPVAMLFGVTDEYNDRSKQALEAWSRYRMFPTLGPIAFDYPWRCVPIQPADMLVHELAASWDKWAHSPTPGQIEITPILAAMVKKPVLGGFAGEEALRKHVANRDWLNPGPPFGGLSGSSS